jgi:hypothetical protein
MPVKLALGAQLRTQLAAQSIDEPKADVMAIVFVLRARIAETHYQFDRCHGTKKPAKNAGLL